MRNAKFLAVAMVLGLVLAACGAPAATPDPGNGTPDPAATPDPGNGEAGGTLVFGGSRLAASLDPSQTSDGESFRILQQIYEPLVDLAPGSVDELVGVLAESWEGEPEGTEYVFNLRQGVTFHDGTPFNAEAVKINFDRWQNFPEELAGNAYYYGNVMDGFGEGNLIQSVEATDEHTVTITLRDPSPTFLYGIALTPFTIVSPAVLEETNADDPATGTFGTDVTQGGTGPFILQEYTPDDSAVLVRNDDYWGEPALLDQLIIRPIADPSARLQALQGGSVQGIDLVSPVDYDVVENDANLVLLERLSYNTLYLAVNPTATDDSPLQELAVRQAVAHAIDKEALIGPFYGGRGSAADIFLPPTSGWFDDVHPAVEVYEFDQDRARELLEDAGFGPDNPPTVEFWYPTEVTRPYMPDARALHEAVTTMLEDVGFVVEAGSAIWGTEYIPTAQSGGYDLHFLGWTGDYDDPGNWYGVHFGYSQGEPNAQFACDHEGLEDALETAEQALDPAERGPAWGEVASIVHEQVCFVTLAHGDTALAFVPEVQGYVANPTGSERFDTVWLDN
jgi:peptide/nickel transport system substrate-binding protein